MPEYTIGIAKKFLVVNIPRNILPDICWCLRPRKNSDDTILSTNPPLSDEAIQSVNKYGKEAGFQLYPTVN